VLDGFRAVVPPEWTVTHARGADIQVLVPDPAGPTWPNGAPRAPVFSSAPADQDMIGDAVALARAADVVIAVVGDTIELTGETRSTATLELQGGQVALLQALAATGTPMVVVLVHSKPAVLPPAALEASALIEAFNPGMQGGRAIAELVLGLVEPRGRLPISVPRHVGQLPVFYNQVRGQHGERYADLTQEPQFAFGEGLAYTTVVYSDLVLDSDVVGLDDLVVGRVTVANTGSRPAHETVQAYVSDRVTSVTWAVRELKAWQHVSLAPGESRTVTIEVPASQCTVVLADGRRVVEPGDFELQVGPSSRAADLSCAGFRIVASG
jgi:beta-glucosidase